MPMPVEYANSAANTEDVKTSVASTMVGNDLVKMINRGMNTDLLKDKVFVKQPKPKINHYNEGFRTYYDDVTWFRSFIPAVLNWNRVIYGFKGESMSISVKFDEQFWGVMKENRQKS